MTRRIVKQKQGQFIIIAALLIAIMTVSVSTIMFGAVTYYKHERWEEYLAIIDNVKIGSYRTVEISLANYTLNNCTDDTILKDNLNQWVNDTKKAYAGFGVVVSYYEDELSYDDWYENEASSAANATFTIDITSVGLTGYKFTVLIFLRMTILDVSWDDEEKELIVSLAVDKEDSTLVTNLEKDNFSILVDDEPMDFTIVQYYSDTYDSFIYEIHCSPGPSQPSLVSVTTIDTRSIKVIVNSTLTPPAETMHVGDISMWYEKQGSQYTVYTKIPILDENGQAVSDATVYLDTTLPDGTVQSFSGETGSDGTVTFSLKSKLVGTYTSMVTDVVKEAWIYDSTSNVETSESLTVS